MALVLVMILLVIDRYFFTEQAKKSQDRLLEENSRLVKAIISKNANEYVMTTSIDKVAPEEKAAPYNDDLVSDDAMSEEQFMDSINKINGR